VTSAVLCASAIKRGENTLTAEAQRTAEVTQRSSSNWAPPKLESLLEFLVLKKHAGVPWLKKDESHLFDFLIHG
jgi:hypothetical protein